ncbi:hypothetical protein [Virgisporangium aurantiacum]|uniref:Uncharacterized protein n=1 Tax=Virgisporangium aurantiacum TaxID=175570 RepID=A0A8J3YXY3_9ACTN|nr:hypothetical protein [Virgisporangium aurantiacum]GIJ54049.1 hypothetical protein Vau01_015650 [Virgisporangium aurantiacum]
MARGEGNRREPLSPDVDDHDRPLMVITFPGLVAEIDRLLRIVDPSHPLAGRVGDLRHHGRCACTPTCRNILTAPAGSAGPYLVQLQRDDEDVIWLSLDPACTAVVDIEVLDESGLGIR